MSNALNRAIACAMFLFLPACGGGGGSHIEPTPPPPAAPSSFPLNSSQTFQTLAVTRALRGSGNTISGEVVLSNRPSNITASYDAAAGTYTVTENVATATFSSANRTTSGFLDVYTKQGTGVTDELKLFGNARSGGSQVGAPFQLTYLSFGIWTHTDTATGDVRKSHILFGYPTASGSMPVTGSATYQTMVNASMFEGGPSFPNTQSEVDGTATFTANFGTGAIGTELSLARQAGGQSLGVFTGTGTIQSGNQFGGTFTSTAATFSNGTFMGGFFGPSAAEMGYNFSITKFNPDPFAGAAVAPQQTYITGAVVGKKQ